MIFSFIEVERANHSIPLMCRILRVSRSGYSMPGGRGHLQAESRRTRSSPSVSGAFIGTAEGPTERHGSMPNFALRA